MEFFSGLYFPVSSPNTGKYGPGKTPYLDTFHAVEACNLTKNEPPKGLSLDPKLSSINFENIHNTFFPNHLSTAVSIKTQKT